MNSTTEIRDFVSSEDLVSVYDQADILVFPSLSDVWGLVVNEAMARGLVILSSYQVVSSLELIQESINSFIFEPTHESLIIALEKLNNDRDLIAKISQENTIKIKNHTLESMVQAHINFISQTIMGIK